MSRNKSIRAYTHELELTWRPDISGEERVWIMPYSPDIERSMRFSLSELAARTKASGRKWSVVDISDDFGTWIANHKAAERLLSGKVPIGSKVREEFEIALASRISAVLRVAGEDEVVALVGIGSIYPFVRASDVIKRIHDDIQGRLLVLFPGSYNETTHVFRLLNARDGFSYRATVIDETKDLQ